jgi:putative spermidine/putrescine transport system substrate-binding protein
MDRRSFLLSTSGLAIAQLLTSCASNSQVNFNVQLLKGSIPGQVVSKFKKSLGAGMHLKFTPVAQLNGLFEKLQTWRRPKTPDQQGWTRYIPRIPLISHQEETKADLVTLGDYWLQGAIQQNLIQPLEVDKYQSWANLPQKWQQLVKRDEKGHIDPQGKIWGAPYLWGNTALIYNRDKFRELGWEPKDWSDLWRPELRSRISLLNHPREVIGLVLKKLGKSYNTENLDEVSALASELRSLNQQVKFYDSQTYLEPLVIGDTWLAVGWSNDIIPVLENNQQTSAVIPQSGTSIWVDLWVHPWNQQSHNPTAYSWIDFCSQSNISKEISLLTKTNSPISHNINASDIDQRLQNLLLVNPEILEKSEFLLPLSTKSKQQYEDLFTKMKTEKL